MHEMMLELEVHLNSVKIACDLFTSSSNNNSSDSLDSSSAVNTPSSMGDMKGSTANPSFNFSSPSSEPAISAPSNVAHNEEKTIPPAPTSLIDSNFDTILTHGRIIRSRAKIDDQTNTQERNNEILTNYCDFADICAKSGINITGLSTERLKIEEITQKQKDNFKKIKEIWEGVLYEAIDYDKVTRNDIDAYLISIDKEINFIKMSISAETELQKINKISLIREELSKEDDILIFRKKIMMEPHLVKFDLRDFTKQALILYGQLELTIKKDKLNYKFSTIPKNIEEFRLFLEKISSAVAIKEKGLRKKFR